MPERLGIGVVSLLQYVAVVFVMEEVTFRMLDSHLQEASARWDFWSALWISVAWGLWHLPMEDDVTWSSIGLLLYVHVPYGLCLSYFWRKTGNLVVPGLCHARAMRCGMRSRPAIEHARGGHCAWAANLRRGTGCPCAVSCCPPTVWK